MVRCYGLSLCDQEKDKHVCYCHFHLKLNIPVSSIRWEKEIKSIIIKREKHNCHYSQKVLKEFANAMYINWIVQRYHSQIVKNIKHFEINLTKYIAGF